MNQEQITAKLSQIQSKGLESTFSLSEAALENAEKLAALNYAASKEALVNADVFIGVSVGNVVSKEMVASMNDDSIIFALANPTPEINREVALEAGARVYGAGVSNVPNQINNALVFPGLFKGALEARVRQITIEMEIAACKALSEVIPVELLSEDYIIPDIFNEKVSQGICDAIKGLSNK